MQAVGVLILLASAVGMTACSSTMQSMASPNSTGNVAARIALSPGSSSVPSGGTLQFTALVEDTHNTGVRWWASVGTISDRGLFTAPTVTSSQAVVVVATSTADPTAHASVSTTVVAPQPLKILTSSLAAGVSGVLYDAALAGAGGATPYQWTIATGALPKGLQLNASTGVISGTPSLVGNFPFTISVKDAATHQAIQALTLAVSSSSTASNFDGPAELPRFYLSSTLANTPAPGKVIQVNAGGDFQGALDNANCGDTITLQAGATFGGVFTFPQKPCDDWHWIIVRTSAADSSLPAEQTRINPCYAGVASLPGRPAFHCTSTQNVMAKLVFINKTGSGPVLFSSGANHYRLIGLEITRSPGTSLVSNLVAPAKDAGADHIVLDRLWVHGTAQDETTRGVYLSGVTSISVVDSFFTDFHCISLTGACVDSQAVAGGAGTLSSGPFKIVNNFLEASGENIIFGGSAATITPTDIEVRRNHFFKPRTWMRGQPGFIGGANGNAFIVKNHFEIKNAQRVLFEANILENNWGGVGQVGYSILLTPKNQAILNQNVCPICLVTDVTIRYSTVSHVPGVLVIGNVESSALGVPKDGERYSIHDVIADDIDAVTYSGRGTFAEITSVPQPNLQSVHIDHVTAFQPNVMFNVGANATQKMVDFGFTNSIINAGLSPFTTTGVPGNCAVNTSPLVLLTACFVPYVFSNNAIIGVPATAPASKWPVQNFFPANAIDVQFVAYNNGNGGDYHLLPSSPYKNAGRDGRDLGADVDAVMAKIDDVP